VRGRGGGRERYIYVYCTSNVVGGPHKELGKRREDTRLRDREHFSICRAAAVRCKEEIRDGSAGARPEPGSRGDCEE
jgi:hypothetical protein